MQLMIRTLAISVLYFASGVAARAQEPAAKKPTVIRPGETSAKSRLETTIPELMQKGGVPGLQIALIENGKTNWLGTFGLRKVDSGQAVTKDTVFEAASLSKTVFAYGVLKLVEQGKLELNAPLTGYLPKPYIDGDDRLGKITARYVLSHRTGFPNWRGDGNALTIRFAPGERFSYSGEGFVYLQKVVEQITGKPLNEYMTEAVFAPLGMTSSSYVWRADFDEKTAMGYGADGQFRETNKPSEANAAASLHTSAGDFALFVEAILNGTGLKPETLREMETPQIAVDPECTNCTDRAPKGLSKNIFWGLGWGITKTNAGKAIWHWGDNGAFKCFVAAYLKQKKGVVLFTNSENGLGIAEDVVQLALGSDLPPFHWLKYERYDSPGRQFSVEVYEKGAKTAIVEFDKQFKAGKISEDSLNSTGYGLLQQKKFSDAIAILRLNVQLHPESWNVYDSLGEAYMDQGDKPLAIRNYEKSLELNPKNDGAAKSLKRLRAE
jgi:CubicO group peptidase (beta-lactamase class C family)